MIGLLFVANSCDEDDPVPDSPSLTAPTTATTVNVGSPASLNFTVTVPGGYKSATVSAGSITAEPAAGATNGNVAVEFTPTSAGATVITLTVTDNNDKTSSTTGTVIAAENAPEITGVPATAEIAAGETLSVPSVTLSAEAGLKSLSVSVNGTDVPDLGEDLSAAGTSVTVAPFEAPQTASFGPGTYTIIFTLTDQNDVSVSVTHVLTVLATPVSVITDNITEDVTWTADNVYELAGRITVIAPAVLTIEAGTVIKGQAGSGANASALLVARGAKIMAMGTAEAPIIMTSVADQIQPGQIISPNLGSNETGLWGGLIVLGNAPIAADAAAVQIEGIPPSDTNGLYGGDDPADSSGEIHYVSIRHGGSNIGEGNEINALTLGGVGNGTVIDHVEIVANEDDGIEPFGGTVNVSNIIIWGVNDDYFDCDQAYSGTIYNFIGILANDPDHGMELDGPEGTVPGSISGSYTLRRGTIKGLPGATGGEYIDLRSDVRCTIDSVYFFNFKGSADVEFDNNGVAQNYLDELINLTNLEFNVSHLTEGNLTIEDIFLERVATDDNDVPTETELGIFTTRPVDPSNVITTTNTVGADASVFTGWTWADAAGELADF